MDNFTVNGKQVKYSQYYDSCTDSSGNIIKEGDYVLHITGKYSYQRILKEVVTLTDDKTQTKFLGYKQGNGQYTALRSHRILLVNRAFVDMHLSLVSNCV